MSYPEPEKFQCPCKNWSYRCGFFYDNCPKCGKPHLYWGSIALIVLTVLLVVVQLGVPIFLLARGS